MSNISLLQRQQSDLVQGKAPIFKDPRILSIPVRGCNEDKVDIRTMHEYHDKIRMLPDPSIPFESDHFNAGFNCSSLVRKGLWDRLLGLSDNLRMTKPDENIVILVFEGMRDSETQRKLFNGFLDQFRESHSHLNDDELRDLTSKYVNPPDSEPIHATGACVDIRLFNDKTKEFLDMGKFGSYWGENKEALTYCANLTDIQKENRSLLLTCSAMAGLVNYPYEWWHFSFGDRYYSYYTNNRFAIYGCE